MFTLAELPPERRTCLMAHRALSCWRTPTEQQCLGKVHSTFRNMNGPKFTVGWRRRDKHMMRKRNIFCISIPNLNIAYGKLSLFLEGL